MGHGHFLALGSVLKAGLVLASGTETLGLVPFFSLNHGFLKQTNKKAPNQNRMHLAGGWCLNEAFGVGAGRREDALGKVHVLCGSRTNPALCLTTTQDSVSSLSLGTCTLRADIMGCRSR